MYGRYLSDGHSNDISADFWRAIMNQDNKAQPQQGDQTNKPGQQGQQPAQNPGCQRLGGSGHRASLGNMTCRATAIRRLPDPTEPAGAPAGATPSEEGR